MSDGQCPDCGAAIKRVIVDVDDVEEVVVLDAVAVWNGRYALDSNDAEGAIPITSPGRQGYVPHADTCPAVSRPRASAL